MASPSYILVVKQAGHSSGHSIDCGTRFEPLFSPDGADSGLAEAVCVDQATAMVAEWNEGDPDYRFTEAYVCKVLCPLPLEEIRQAAVDSLKAAVREEQERKELHRLQQKYGKDAEPPPPAPVQCPRCHVARQDKIKCCNPKCGGHWGTGCYCCHHPSYL